MSRQAPCRASRSAAPARPPGASGDRAIAISPGTHACG